MDDVTNKTLSFRENIADLAKTFWEKVRKIWKALFSNWQASTGTSIMLFFILLAFIGPLILPYNGIGDPVNKFAAPSASHWFGCDSQGRDVLAMIIAGTKDIFAISLLTGIFTVVIGVLIGMISAMSKPWVDKILQLITNMFLTIPSFPILMMISAVITIRDNFTFAIILALWSWPGLARAVRAQIISLKERDFIQICHVMKMPQAHIIFFELMPNISSYILINLIMVMRSAITSSVGIMFLGVAEMDPSNWGAMLYDIMNSGALMINSAFAYCLAPVLTIALFQMGVVNLANGLDETLNPRLKKN